MDTGWWTVITVSVIAALIVLSYLILRSPFIYPYCDKTIDISGKRSPDIYVLIDSELCANGFDEYERHYNSVKEWKASCEAKIEKSVLKKLRKKQYDQVIDDEQLFRFELVRKQTRYKQVNYVKYPYVVVVHADTYCCSYAVLKNRFEALADINFECTLPEYHSSCQRRVMTKALREEIAKRDNYTCRICGKYMPDGVGLQIDHIMPVSKGGKSVPSNLQVLCSKCNGRKSGRLFQQPKQRTDK